MNVYIKNHCIVWGALVESYHGINAYGKNVAEIDAKYFLPNPYTDKNKITTEDFLEAGRNLIELCRAFSKTYACKVSLDSMDCWAYSEILLDTKAYVKVELHKKTSNGNGNNGILKSNGIPEIKQEKASM